MTTIDEKYAAELKQADIDHHTPTAGAMTGHILANLQIQAFKLQQAKWYVKGINRPALVPVLSKLWHANLNLADRLGDVLLDEGEVAPSTSDEFKQYSMLTEAGQDKYRSAEALINITVHDANTHNLFIDRAIKLAEKEERPALASFLIELRGHNNHAIRELQFYLGNDARTGLDEEDDDDED